MERWVRFEQANKEYFGKVAGEAIAIYAGDMFGSPAATGKTTSLSAVTLLTPTNPGKLIGLWNNFHARAEKEGLSRPNQPLYFIKAASSFLPANGVIRRPSWYEGVIVFEGELGVVIGKRCKEVPQSRVDEYIFGYTCVNDVTARSLLQADPSFPQWSRAKGMDTFGVFGPCILRGADPSHWRVRTLLDGEEKQNYPVSDMFFSPKQIVSLISHDMTLNPGDIIACGTSVGTEPMAPGSRVEVVIDGIGTLANTFDS